VKRYESIAVRVARLEFSMTNFRNLALFEVVWRERMLFGMYAIVWHVLGLFQWCWQKKKVVWHFLKPLTGLL